MRMVDHHPSTNKTPCGFRHRRAFVRFRSLGLLTGAEMVSCRDGTAGHRRMPPIDWRQSLLRKIRECQPTESPPSTYREGSTDKFSTAILTYLFCPHYARDPPHSFGYASGLPPCSDEKIYANLTDFILSAIP